VKSGKSYVFTDDVIPHKTVGQAYKTATMCTLSPQDGDSIYCRADDIADIPCKLIGV